MFFLLCFLQAQVYVYGEDPVTQEPEKAEKATSYHGLTMYVMKSGSDVIVHITPAGDVTVESAVAIKSLTLFSIDGRLIYKDNYTGVETQRLTSLQGKPAGMYLIRVETEKGTVVKKVVKSLNK